MRILTLTTLFPNPVMPHHGVFVEQRLRHLLATGKVEARVIAPVPWFPFTSKAFGSWAQYARVPAAETRHGIAVIHPRYPVMPKVGMNLAPWLMVRALRPVIEKMIADGYEPDLIDAHYFYPDGVAAVMLGELFNKPVVVTARGTDINLIPRYRRPRMMIQEAARKAAALITVCDALRQELLALGADAAKTQVLRNGVDLVQFRPVDRKHVREKLGLDGTVLLSVGHLTERKGHDLAIRAIPALAECSLVIAGGGELEHSLRQLAADLGVADRVRFIGIVSQAELRDWYGAADILVLMSSREGWANVLLESMACGTPVVATDIWGTPEVVCADAAGRLCPERTPESLVDTVRALLDARPSRDDTRRYAEGFSWDDTTAGQLALFESIVHGSDA